MHSHFWKTGITTLSVRKGTFAPLPCRRSLLSAFILVSEWLWIAKLSRRIVFDKRTRKYRVSRGRNASRAIMPTNLFRFIIPQFQKTTYLGDRKLDTLHRAMLDTLCTLWLSLPKAYRFLRTSEISLHNTFYSLFFFSQVAGSSRLRLSLEYQLAWYKLRQTAQEKDFSS